MLPFDVFGTAIDTAEAIVFADINCPRRTERGRTTTFFVDDVCDGIPTSRAVSDVDVVAVGSVEFPADVGTDVDGDGDSGVEDGSLGAGVGSGVGIE